MRIHALHSIATAELLETRRRQGKVRVCHGDLHLRNICLIEEAPTLFDAVEFNEDISCIDVLYDLAFLLMDFWRRDLPAHANVVFNEYVTQTVELDGLPLLPLFLSCRAAVRAKTSVSGAKVQPDERLRRELQIASREYLALARRLLRPPRPCVIAIGGFSGSGKSTLARRLAPGVGAPPGALILRSDVIRKTLLGVSPSTRLGPEGYESDVSERVYHTIAEHARTIVTAGHAVIADAVFASQHEREQIAGVARDADIPCVGLWLDGPPALLATRLHDRVADASDATADVLERQVRAGVGPLTWHRLDGSLDVEGVQRGAEAQCRDCLNH